MSNLGYMFYAADFENIFGFREYTYSLFVLEQLNENNIHKPIKLLSTYLKNCIYERIDFDTYSLWKGWHDMKNKYVKELL